MSMHVGPRLLWTWKRFDQVLVVCRCFLTWATTLQSSACRTGLWWKETSRSCLSRALWVTSSCCCRRALRWLSDSPPDVSAQGLPKGYEDVPFYFWFNTSFIEDSKYVAFLVTYDSFRCLHLLTGPLLSGCSCPEKSWTTPTNRRPGTCTRKTLVSPCSSLTHSQRGYTNESVYWTLKSQSRARWNMSAENFTHSRESHRESLCVCVFDSCVPK